MKDGRGLGGAGGGTYYVSEGRDICHQKGFNNQSLSETGVYSIVQILERSGEE